MRNPVIDQIAMPLPVDHVLAAGAQADKSWDVLAFIGSLGVGGCERHLATVYPRLAAAGLKVGIVTITPGGPLEDAIRAGGVDIMTVGRRGLSRKTQLSKLAAAALAVSDIARFLRRGRVGVAHFYLPGAYILGGMAALLAGHGNRLMSRRSLNDYQAARPLAAKVEHFLHRKMRLLTANARAGVAQLIAEGAPAERTLLLPNGIDFASHSPTPDRDAARMRFAIGADTLAIAIVANLIPYKGHADLLDALGRIASRGDRDWVLLAAGRDDGPGRGLQARAASLGIGAHIRWLGLIDDVAALWQASDIGVLASHEEGLPNTLLEAMAAGVPVVATRVGGVPDIATDNVDALLVAPRDPDAMAAALLRLFDDARLRARLGARAAARVRDAFSLAACVEAYHRLYALMLRRPYLSGEDIAEIYRTETRSGPVGVAEGSFVPSTTGSATKVQARG